MTYWQNSGLIRLKGNYYNKRSYNNKGEAMFQCAGCFYNILLYGANEAGGKLYCGGCNADLKDPGTPIKITQSQGQENQQQGTFTNQHESEEDKKEAKKKKEKPNLEPVEDENYLLSIGTDIFNDENSELLDREAQKYYNNVGFRAWLKKKKGLSALPYHVFRGDLSAMRHYWKEFETWRTGGSIPKPPILDNPLENWDNINPAFTIEITKQWKSKGFSKEQCRKWLEIGTKTIYPDFYAWLRDYKHANIDWILKHRKKDEVRHELELEFDKWEVEKDKENDSD